MCYRRPDGHCLGLFCIYNIFFPTIKEIPTAVNFGFLDRNRYFPFKQLLSYSHEAEWTSFQTHYFSENLVVSGIEPGTSGSVARTLTTRPQSISHVSLKLHGLSPQANYTDRATAASTAAYRRS
jgi:hypothetical protein